MDRAAAFRLELEERGARHRLANNDDDSVSISSSASSFVEVEEEKKPSSRKKKPQKGKKSRPVVLKPSKNRNIASPRDKYNIDRGEGISKLF
mmetsp:Transcript_39936/g.44710  ORF Transcript_39936/g.44710 Transcript_39936/m.44710 type:complete len:92 (-) Transcript_39936:681-956(-)